MSALRSHWIPAVFWIVVAALLALRVAYPVTPLRDAAAAKAAKR